MNSSVRQNFGLAAMVLGLFLFGPICRADIPPAYQIQDIRHHAYQLTLQIGDLVYAAKLQRRHFTREQKYAFQDIELFQYRVNSFYHLLVTDGVGPVQMAAAFDIMLCDYDQVRAAFDILHQTDDVATVIVRIDDTMDQLCLIYHVIYPMQG